MIVQQTDPAGHSTSETENVRSFPQREDRVHHIDGIYLDITDFGHIGSVQQ